MVRELMTKWDYGFLMGDTDMWELRGAAYVSVASWCNKHGWGEFGKPTALGLTLMRKYEAR